MHKVFKERNTCCLQILLNMKRRYNCEGYFFAEVKYNL